MRSTRHAPGSVRSGDSDDSLNASGEATDRPAHRDATLDASDPIALNTAGRRTSGTPRSPTDNSGHPPRRPLPIDEPHRRVEPQFEEVAHRRARRSDERSALHTRQRIGLRTLPACADRKRFCGHMWAIVGTEPIRSIQLRGKMASEPAFFTGAGCGDRTRHLMITNPIGAVRLMAPRTSAPGNMRAPALEPSGGCGQSHTVVDRSWTVGGQRGLSTRSVLCG